MALIIETGAIVADANSFVTLEEIREYAEARGRTLPVDDEDLEPFAHRAMDYIKSRRGDFDGTRVSDTQPLPFPRTGMYIDNVLIADDFMPLELIELQCALTVELANGLDLFPVQTGQAVKRKKTGPLEKEFFGPSLIVSVPILDALIEPLLGSGGRFALRVRRV